MTEQRPAWFTVRGVIDGRAAIFEATTQNRDDALTIHKDLIRSADCVDARIIAHYDDHSRAILISARQRDNGNRWMHEGAEAVFPRRNDEQVQWIDGVEEGDEAPEPPPMPDSVPVYKRR